MEVGLKDEIDNQIERAGNYLERVSAEFNATGRLNADALIGCCAVLFEIVENQQIEMLRLRRDVNEGEKRANGFLEAYEDVCRRNDSLMDTIHKLKEGGAR